MSVDGNKVVSRFIERVQSMRLNWVGPTFEGGSIFIIASLVLTVLAGEYAEMSGYQPEYRVIFRTTGFLAAAMAIFIAATIRQYEFYEKIKLKGLLPISGLVLINVYSCKTLAYVLLGGGFTTKSVIFCFFAYLFIYVWVFWMGGVREKASDATRTLLATLLAVVALFYPVAASKYLNSESYASIGEIERVAGDFEKILTNQSTLIGINLDSSSANVFKSNLRVAENTPQMGLIGYYNMKASDNGVEVGLSLDNQNLHLLCLLGDYTLVNARGSYLSLYECMTSIFSQTDHTRFASMRSILKIPITSTIIREQISSQVGKINIDNLRPKKGSEYENQLRYMFVKGAFFHHYNSIALGIGNAGDVESYFSNQYGFGPLILIKIVSMVAGLPIFDSIYIAVVSINILVGLLVVVIAQSYKGWEKRLLFMGLGASVAVTYSISNVMAPMLFFIRMLPTILIFCLILFALKNGKEVRHEKWIRSSYFFLLVLVALYNFEYAVLTCLGIVAAGIVLRDRFYLLSGVSAAILALIMKYSFAKGGSSEANYAAYMSGVGLGDLSVFTLAFSACAGIVLARIIKSWLDGRASPEIVVLSSIFIALCTKVAWMGSANHIGPLFLLMAILAVLDSRLESNGRSVMYRRSNDFYSFVVFCTLVSSLIISFRGFPHNSYIKSGNYEISKLSAIFKMSTDLKYKLEEFAVLYKPGDLVLSPIDNALSLRVSARVTAPYPDLSTNLNAPVDFEKVRHEYIKTENGRRIIVDSLVSNPILRQNTFDQAALIPNSLKYGLASYERQFSTMEVVLNGIKDAGFTQCESRLHFVVYCPPKH